MLVVAQENKKSKDLFLEAESYFLYEEYVEALPIYAKLKDQLPDNFNIDYKLGRCYINLPYEKQHAVEYLELASKHISKTYKEGNFKEINAPLDVLFYLGDAYRINNQLEKAIKSYQSFKSQSNDKVYDLNLVDDQIKACHRGIDLEKSPVDISESNLGEVINSRFSDTNPVVSENETTLVYASKLPFYQALYYSKKEKGKWTTPINMLPDLGMDGDCFPTSISADGTELYIYRLNEFKGDIFVTNFQNGKWSKIRKLNDNINTKYWESHACISHDGKTLYFTSNRKGGFGGLDIYKSTRSSGDNWGLPINLGPTINSSYNEETPFISSDGKRLYFSSFGHETMGGYDIFYSDQKSDGSWSKPVNLGYPINTSDDDVFFNPIRDGSIAYTAKFDKDGFGKYDIYRYEIFSDQNPRKYFVSGTIQIPYSWSDISGVRIAVYDKNKKDTVFRQIIRKDQFSFETTKGNFEIHISGSGLHHQIIPLVIAKGSKKTDISINALMKTQPSQVVSEMQESKIITENKTVNKDSLNQKNNKALLSDSLNNKGDTVKMSETKEPLISPVQSDTSKLIVPGDKSSIPALFYVLIFGLIGIVFIILFFILKRRRKDKQKST